MIEITVFEEAMCCSTGVCGPDPDEELVRFTNTVEKLNEQYSDVRVERVNMSSDVETFLQHDSVRAKVQDEGPDVLPITVTDGTVIAEREYLSYDTLSASIDQRHKQEA